MQREKVMKFGIARSFPGQTCVMNNVQSSQQFKENLVLFVSKVNGAELFKMAAALREDTKNNTHVLT